MFDILLTAVKIIGLFLGALLIYDLAFTVGYHIRARPYKRIIRHPKKGAKTTVLMANTSADGWSLKPGVMIVRMGWVAHWGVPNALDILHQYARAFPELTIIVPSPPGFGGTTHPKKYLPKEHFEALPQRGFEALAGMLVDGLLDLGAKSFTFVGASMGGNIAVEEALYLQERHFHQARIASVVPFSGVVHSLPAKELKARFTHPMGMVDRLALKWWEPGIPWSTRLMTRGVVRTMFHEFFLDIILRPDRWKLVGTYQQMMARTRMNVVMDGMVRSGRKVLAVTGLKDRLTFDLHKALAGSEVPYTFVEGKTHLRMCIDAKLQVEVIRRCVS